jgi:hypothetical protein
VALIGMVIVLFLREVPLRQAGQQQKREGSGEGKPAAAAA